MKVIAVATTGGDAPGMNATIRAVVRSAIYHKFKVLGFRRGFEGILSDDYTLLNARDVGGIIHLGGTFLKTSRSEEMKTKEGVTKASRRLTNHNIKGLVIIGGDGSFKAAVELQKLSGIPVIGIPATIDNDLAGTDTTIGFDTAVNTGLEAIDKIRDTATSHERVFVVEVMGRDRGFIAIEVGLAAGAELILIPELACSSDAVSQQLLESNSKGKKSGIVVAAEGATDCLDLMTHIKEKTGFEVRLTRLGHIQRGGPPTAFSRQLACRMGAASIDFLLQGKKKDMTAIQRGNIIPVDLEYAVSVEKPIDKQLYDLAYKLAI